MVAEHIFFMLLIVSRRIHLKQVRIVQSTCKLFEFTQQIDRGNELRDAGVKLFAETSSFFKLSEATQEIDLAHCTGR